jgi:hypothetical protein
MTIFPESFDQNVLIERVNVADEITVTLRRTSLSARCPCCRTASKQVQSRNIRPLLDLPSSGRPVHLIVHVRRFFCKKSICAQKIFAERLPELCRPHAQRTLRLQKAPSQLGLAYWPFRGACKSASVDQTQHVWSREVRSAQASCAVSSCSQKDKQRRASISSSSQSCEETENRREVLQLSVDVSCQDSCVRPLLSPANMCALPPLVRRLDLPLLWHQTLSQRG